MRYAVNDKLAEKVDFNDRFAREMERIWKLSESF